MLLSRALAKVRGGWTILKTVLVILLQVDMTGDD